MQTIHKHQYSKQPDYAHNEEKKRARDQIIKIYRDLTGRYSIPPEKGYWTFCNRQPDVEGAEIVQFVNEGLLTKEQFFGIDNDINQEGIIEANKKDHPEANWFCGDWFEMIDKHYQLFNPALIYFDYTKTVATTACHRYLARTMNICPEGTIVVANLMISDGHSSRRFDKNDLVQGVNRFLRNRENWLILDEAYIYKASRTDMATFIFRKKN